MSTPEDLRARNVATLVAALRHHGSLSRAALARVTGLSRATVVSIVDDLDRRGFTVEGPDDAGDGQRGRGRPAGLVRLHPSAGVALGIFVGREDMRVALTDLSLTVMAHRHARFEIDTPAEVLLDLAADLGDAVLGEAGVPRANLIGAGWACRVPRPRDRRGRSFDPRELGQSTRAGGPLHPARVPGRDRERRRP